MEQNSTILDALIVEKNVMFYLLFFIVIVAALCILSAQITFVVQKTREIGMLKALGATNLQISGVFLSQSAIIGVLGVLAGYGLGILALTYRNEFLHFMNHLTGWELFPASIYGFSELPAIIDTRDIAVICGSSFVICILGGVLPALRAGRLKPVEALRYGIKWKTSNIQHSNIERRMTAESCLVRCSALNVGCSMFHSSHRRPAMSEPLLSARALTKT